MKVTIEQVKESVKALFGWDESYALEIQFPDRTGQSGGDTVDYLAADGDHIVRGLNEKGEVTFIEIV